jgi:hypothetical protein
MKCLLKALPSAFTQAILPSTNLLHILHSLGSISPSHWQKEKIWISFALPFIKLLSRNTSLISNPSIQIAIVNLFTLELYLISNAGVRDPASSRIVNWIGKLKECFIQPASGKRCGLALSPRILDALIHPATPFFSIFAGTGAGLDILTLIFGNTIADGSVVTSLSALKDIAVGGLDDRRMFAIKIITEYGKRSGPMEGGDSSLFALQILVDILDAREDLSDFYDSLFLQYASLCKRFV